MFQILLAIHILSAVLFIGNIVTAAFWKVRADRSGNLEIIAVTTRSLLQADYAFTTPGISGLLITGIWMVGLTGWDRFQQTWLSVSLVLLIITGLIWVALLLPLQFRMARLSREGAASGAPDPAYAKASRLWAIFGGIATLLPVIILFLMVLKPGV
ncbi:MAG: DUF2269 family protein [Dehalococcoidia bacterium]